MAQPTAYDRQASFSNIQAQAPNDPLPGDTLDSEFNAAKVTLDAILANLELIQRDDGALANGSVGLDQLSEEIEVGWQAPEVWVTGTAYVSGDTVFHGSGFYRLLTAHTAGVFATDLAADKWELIVDLSGLTIVAADQIAVTPAGGIAATDVQAALEELDSEKAASSHTHPSSAISDSTTAGRTLLTAASDAAQRSALGLGALALEDEIPVTDINAQLALSGIIEPSALSADQNNWAPTGLATASTIRMSASATGVNLTGILAPATDGEIKILENVGTTYAITLSPSSASSAAANRFLIPKPIVIGPNSSVVLRYDLDDTTPRWRLFDRASHFPRGHIDGLTLSNNGSDATNDIDIAAGEARGSRGILDLVLTTALTGKRLDADWAAGSSAGMRYSGAAVADTTYHIFLIGKADGTVDVFAYAGGTDPTSVLPTGYIDYRMIGSIVRVSSSIKAFFQVDDTFIWNVPVLDVSAAVVTTASSTYALTVPSGLIVEAIFNVAQLGNAAAVFVHPYAGMTGIAASGTANPLGTIFVSSNSGPTTGDASGRAFTNTSAAVKATASASTTFSLSTLGFVHPRGRNL